MLRLWSTESSKKQCRKQSGSEALIAGIPIIASHQGGLLESLGHSCFFVDDYTSEEAWCDVLNKVLSNEDNLHIYKKKGMEYAKKFSVATVTEKIDKLLNYPKFNPHGEPIPDADFKLPSLNAILLNEISINKKYNFKKPPLF